jgi:2-keto-4-pentenoate hydratase/2-oxohepta-3-ene-1,7-dioic acid hydratase in catechol pathway
VGFVPPSEPVLFLKAGDTVNGPYDPIRIPRCASKTDWEVELAVVIGRTARYFDSPTAADTRIAGLTISNDVSERAFQLERGGQWEKGKNCETFNPLGPWLRTLDDDFGYHDLKLRHGSTASYANRPPPET